MTGSKGQIGIPLIDLLCKEVGRDNVIATDVSDKKVGFPCREEQLDIMDFKKFEALVKDNKITYIVHLASILSALGERFPDRAVDVNIYGFINALNLAREYKCGIFSPSSIASLGGDKYPKDKTPDDTIH